MIYLPILAIVCEPESKGAFLSFRYTPIKIVYFITSSLYFRGATSSSTGGRSPLLETGVHPGVPDTRRQPDCQRGAHSTSSTGHDNVIKHNNVIKQGRCDDIKFQEVHARYLAYFHAFKTIQNLAIIRLSLE